MSCTDPGQWMTTWVNLSLNFSLTKALRIQRSSFYNFNNFLIACGTFDRKQDELSRRSSFGCAEATCPRQRGYPSAGSFSAHVCALELKLHDFFKKPQDSQLIMLGPLIYIIFPLRNVTVQLQKFQLISKACFNGMEYDQTPHDRRKGNKDTLTLFVLFRTCDGCAVDVFNRQQSKRLTRYDPPVPVGWCQWTHSTPSNPREV